MTKRPMPTRTRAPRRQIAEATHVGKIGRLPRELRDEVCKWMDDGVSGREICKRLNRRAEVRAAMKMYFDGEPVNDSNLSEWRGTGYQEWRVMEISKAIYERDMDRIERIQEATGCSINEATAKIASGKLFFIGQAAEGGKVLEVVEGVLALKEDEREAARLVIREKMLEQSADRLKLDNLKARTQFCQGVLKGIEDKEAQRIAGMNISNDEKIALMRKHFFADVDEFAKTGGLKIPE